MTERDKLVREEIEESERTRDAAPPAGTRGVRKNREASSVYSLRLPNDVIAQLNAVAEELDVPVSALARGFIADGLAARGDGDVQAAFERLERNVHMLRSRVLSSGPDVSAVGGATERVPDLTWTSVRLVNPTGSKFEVFQERSGTFRFRLKDGDGEVIAVGEAFSTKAAALRGAEAAQRAADDADVVDLTGA